MSPEILIGILGSVASIASLLISGPTKQSKVIHVVYALVVTVIVSGSVLYVERVDSKNSFLEQQLKEKEMLSRQAEHLLEKYQDTSYSESGDYRGSILGALAFLEKHKNLVPETYERAKSLAEQGVLITQTTPESGQANHDEKKRLRDGAKALRILIESLAYPK